MPFTSSTTNHPTITFSIYLKAALCKVQYTFPVVLYLKTNVKRFKYFSFEFSWIFVMETTSVPLVWYLLSHTLNVKPHLQFSTVPGFTTTQTQIRLFLRLSTFSGQRFQVCKVMLSDTLHFLKTAFLYILLKTLI